MRAEREAGSFREEKGMKRQINFRDYVVAGIVFGCVSVSNGAGEERLETEEVFGWGSPVSLSPELSDEENSFGIFSSGTSSSDSEGEGRERDEKKSRFRRTKEFFEKRAGQRKKVLPSVAEESESAYETDSEEVTSERSRRTPLKKEGQRGEEQAKNRSLKELSQLLDKQVYKWNHFEVPISDNSLDEMRKQAQKKFEELAAEFVKQTPILNEKGSEGAIKEVIGAKVSQIMGPLRHKWEVWGGDSN